MIEKSYRFDRCVDSRFRRKRRHCRISRKLITEKVTGLQAMIDFTGLQRTLETGSQATLDFRDLIET